MGVGRENFANELRVFGDVSSYLVSENFMVMPKSWVMVG